MYIYKVAVLVLLASITVVYTNCGSPFSTQSKLAWQSNALNASEASYEGFKTTVWPITRANCASCHEASQTPYHASTDYKKAHDEVLSNHKVNFSNIPGSRLVAKLRDESHNCWGNCAANAAEMQTAIEDWYAAIEAADATNPAPIIQPPVAEMLRTPETLPIAQELASATNVAKSPTIEVAMGSAVLTAPMAKGKDAFGDFLSVPDDGTNQTLAATDATAGLANFDIKLPAAGTYRIWGYVIAADANSNAFYAGIAPATNPTAYIGGIRTWDITASANPTWRQMPGTIAVPSAGNYRLTLRERKDGTQIYRIFVTADTTFNGSDVASYIGVTLKWDISAIVKENPGTVFYAVDLSDYDSYTYLITNPRIMTATKNVRVKNIRLMLNGAYNPQNSTYTTVDKVATPTAGQLSGFPMIVLKDQGSAKDKIYFEFEILETYSGTINNASLTAFQTTVYPISRANCVACHSATRPHASPDVLTAHDYVLSANLVDFNTPSNSLIANKIRNGHQGINATTGANLAAQYEAAIVQWKAGRGP